MSKEKFNASWFDNFIGFFSPQSKLRRLQYKYATDVVRRKYEGADKGRRSEGWVTVGSDANSEIGASLSLLRNRARDLIRNNTYAARGIQVIVANTVGRGIMGQVKLAPTRNQEPNGPSRSENELNAMWKAWAETTVCDYDGRHDFYGLQRIVMRSLVEGGDVLVRRHFVNRQTVIGPDGIEREVPPIKLQILEGDFLNSAAVTKANNGNRVIQGVEFDKNGKRVAYHLYQDHPGAVSTLGSINSFNTIRVPAEDILHDFRTDRAGQVRGVPWLANGMLKLKDFDDYEDAQLIRQKIAACFSVFVHDITGVEAPLTDSKREALGEKVEPGIIEILPQGKDITFAKPPEVKDYSEYTTVVLRSIASGLGITYEAMTGDLSNVNFSSARMGWLEMQRNIDMWRNNIMRIQFLDPVFGWFINGAKILGKRTNSAKITWTPPRREMIDPTKEVPALQTAVRSGFTSLSEAIRQSGKNPEDVFEEIKRDNDTIDKLKLTLDTDPRKDKAVNS
jgi:lambda family phage portal protein